MALPDGEHGSFCRQESTCKRNDAASQYNVVVVAHHRIGAQVDGKHLRQLVKADLDPAASVLEVAAGDGILAAQECAANAATDTMVIRCLLGIDQSAAYADIRLPEDSKSRIRSNQSRWYSVSRTPSASIIIPPHVLRNAEQ